MNKSAGDFYFKDVKNVIDIPAIFSLKLYLNRWCIGKDLLPFVT